MEANYINGYIDLSWKALNNNGMAKVWLATTNYFKTGEKDDYHLLTEVPVSKKHVVIDVTKYPSKFYKVVLEAPGNTANRWLILDQQK